MPQAELHPGFACFVRGNTNLYREPMPVTYEVYARNMGLPVSTNTQNVACIYARACIADLDKAYSPSLELIILFYVPSSEWLLEVRRIQR